MFATIRRMYEIVGNLTIMAMLVVVMILTACFGGAITFMVVDKFLIDGPQWIHLCIVIGAFSLFFAYESAMALGIMFYEWRNIPIPPWLTTIMKPFAWVSRGQSQTDW